MSCLCVILVLGEVLYFFKKKWFLFEVFKFKFSVVEWCFLVLKSSFKGFVLAFQSHVLISWVCFRVLPGFFGLDKFCN